MQGYFDGWHMGGMWFWWIIIVFIVGAVIWMGLAFSRRDINRPEESPEQVLKRRFAKGEINREEYERMLSDLRK